ncbi:MULTISPECIES: hypothetical protein [Bradyrhizobium]|uniref:hypothetical protein n=1 Tax=Bradyrhizobium TaxID=374 RepID=UPI0012BBC68C|nr:MULTISPECIES: hypothetical protein [Bradyrhizobium]WLB86799.1 hypothetical protein QIH91_28665 [Bradyrhizobium japonicum USDA 135]GLR97644.1 hypothetical protein GCM10007858_52860 [Bradyrhizobium liaoningense]
METHSDIVAREDTCLRGTWGRLPMGRCIHFAVHSGLRERWPDPNDELGLRMLAMIAIGVVRLSTDIWSQEGGERSITEVTRAIFSSIETKF